MIPRWKLGTKWLGWLVLGWLCTGAGESFAQTNEPPSASPRLPSMVLIVTDGLGYGELGCYGQKRIQTPRIDELAAESFRFTDFHAGAADDLLARVALLTGKILPAWPASDASTLAEQLKKAGYHSGYIGYWGLGGTGSPDACHRRGFDETAVYGSLENAQNLYADHLFRHDPYTGFEGRVPLVKNGDGNRQVYLPDLLTQAAVRFCRQNKPDAVKAFRPFFLVVSYPVPAAVTARSGPVPEATMYADEDWSELQKARAGAITQLDRNVGEILDQLDESGAKANTIVLITSTLGPAKKSSGAADTFSSTGAFSPAGGKLSEGRLRVPLIVSWPFWIRSGKTSDLLLAGQDIAPTLLEAARLDPGNGLGGLSFLPTLQGRPQTNHHAQLRWTVADERGPTQRAVEQGRWKLIDPGDGQALELYDLIVDPGETRNISEQHPEVLRELKTLLGGAPPPPADRSSPPAG